MSNQTTTTPVNIDVYGKNGPAAADFRRGATTRAEIEQATEARRNQRIGDYYNVPRDARTA